MSGRTRASSRRRLARQVALQLLYGIDLNPVTTKEAMRRYRLSFGTGGLDPDSERLMLDLVDGTCRERDRLDEIITRASRNWRVARMAAVDRNLLRLATYELIHHSEIPRRVTLNEAVELAKSFGSNESRAFVNGVLDRIALLLSTDEERG